MFMAILIFGAILIYNTRRAQRGDNIFSTNYTRIKSSRRGGWFRSTEMGKPVLFVPGIQDMDQVETVCWSYCPWPCIKNDSSL